MAVKPGHALPIRRTTSIELWRFSRDIQRGMRASPAESEAMTRLFGVGFVEISAVRLRRKPAKQSIRPGAKPMMGAARSPRAALLMPGSMGAGSATYRCALHRARNTRRAPCSTNGRGF